MRLKNLFAVCILSLLGGCTVYPAGSAYYQPTPYVAAPAPVYQAPAAPTPYYYVAPPPPVFIPPIVSFGFYGNYNYGNHYHHYR